MDAMRAGGGSGGTTAEPALDERPPEIGSDERRMHVRAYNFWMSLLGGRAYPSIADLDPGKAADFGPHAVLLDFTADGDPAIAYLGDRLRCECGIDEGIRSVADVPHRSLLGRLTRQYRDILANRAPVGFEAEFVDERDTVMLYRGILMPFSSDDVRIDFVYGVINWKALADRGEAERLAAAARAAMAAKPAVPLPSLDVPVWADGPGGALGDEAADGSGALPARLEAARAASGQAERARTEARAALHHALGLAYDLLVDADEDPACRAALSNDLAGPVGPHALVAMLFGERADPERACMFADALACARRLVLPRGAFARHAEGLRGGIRAMAAAQRAA